MLEGAREVVRIEPGEAGARGDEMGHRETLAVVLDPVAHRLRLPDEGPVVGPDAGAAADGADRGRSW